MLTPATETLSTQKRGQGLFTPYHRQLSTDRFGRLFVGNRVSPANLKADGDAFAWQLVSTGEYRYWSTRTGWSDPTTREEAQEAVYCINHDC